MNKVIICFGYVGYLYFPSHIKHFIMVADLQIDMSPKLRTTNYSSNLYFSFILRKRMLNKILIKLYSNRFSSCYYNPIYIHTCMHTHVYNSQSRSFISMLLKNNIDKTKVEKKPSDCLKYIHYLISAVKFSRVIDFRFHIL